jgi:hypothetical protein
MDQRIVYLDISHWYALGRAAQGDPISPEHPAILAALQDEVDTGRLMIPLSSVTYEELTENPRDQFREPAADVMWRLSKTATIAPASKLVDEELVVELNRRFGRPRFPAKVQKFGHGVGFAFGTGRLTAVVPPGKWAEVEAKIGMSLADAEAQLEYYILATPGSLRGQISSFDPNGWRREADAELTALRVMLDNIHRDGTSITGRPADAVYARQLAGDIRENFRVALTTAGYADTFTMPLRNGEETTDFIRRLPTQRVATELKIHYAKNSQTNWKINHLRDIKALSAAIPYTDAVVTDRDACTAATTRTHLDQEFNTAVFSQLTELRDYLGL